VPPQLTRTENVPGFRNPQWVMVRVSDADLPAIADKVHDLHGRLEPARPGRLLEIMFQLIQRYKQHEKQRTSADWEALAHEYVADLGHFSEAHILEALVEHRRNSKWFPHQSELIPICEGLAGQDRALRRRGQVLLGQRAPYSWEQLPPDMDSKEWISAERMTEMRAELEAKFHRPAASVTPIRGPQTVGDALAGRDHGAVETLRAVRKGERA
jgi:hypothetical protein